MSDWVGQVEGVRMFFDFDMVTRFKHEIDLGIRTHHGCIRRVPQLNPDFRIATDNQWP